MVPGEQIWSELEPRLRTVHAQLEPMVVAQAQLGPDEGGPPLSRIVAYPAVDPRPHWHFVTCGLSASRFIEGYPDAGGVELTFRLGRKPSEKTPPKWVVTFLQQLGRRAFSDDGRIAAGETVDLAPHWEQPDTALTAGFYVAASRRCRARRALSCCSSWRPRASASSSARVLPRPHRRRIEGPTHPLHPRRASAAWS